MSEQINHGGPAFPVNEILAPDGSHERWAEDGMSMRDYFAAKAMQGMWASDQPGYECSGASEALLQRATTAYAQADAMLKARESAGMAGRE